jgi:purine-nucleoside phosphorylase
MIPTPHIDAASREDIAEAVLLPGDPLRARYIAEKYLKDPKVFNSSRNMLGYTGTYLDVPISVMGTGMGMPSAGIYSYELIHFYGVKKLLRIGSCGSLQPEIKLRDIIMALTAHYDSNFASQYQLNGCIAPGASYSLLNKAVEVAKSQSKNFYVGSVLSSDIFYSDQSDMHMKWSKIGTLAVEMEAAALYMNAARAKVESLCLLTVSDSLVSGEKLSAEAREKSFDDMIQIALRSLC